jgi:BlaI family transcriptional regulator, penicillinase repressor
VGRPAPSKGELEVARVLWDLGEGTVRAVHEALPPERGVDFVTVQTYLRRLETKGYVKSRSAGRTKIYSPRVRPGTVIRETVDDLVDRLFGGETLPLVRHLVEDRRITDAELAELRDLIDRLQHEGDDR